MHFIKKCLKNWILWLILCVISFTGTVFSMVSDGYYHDTRTFVLLILSFLLLIVFLSVRSINDGIRKLLTLLICSFVVFVFAVVMNSMFYYMDIREVLMPVSAFLFFLSGSILLLRLVRRK